MPDELLRYVECDYWFSFKTGKLSAWLNANAASWCVNGGMDHNCSCTGQLFARLSESKKMDLWWGTTRLDSFPSSTRFAQPSWLDTEGKTWIRVHFPSDTSGSRKMTHRALSEHSAFRGGSDGLLVLRTEGVQTKPGKVCSAVILAVLWSACLWVSTAVARQKLGWKRLRPQRCTLAMNNTFVKIGNKHQGIYWGFAFSQKIIISLSKLY